MNGRVVLKPIDHAPRRVLFLGGRAAGDAVRLDDIDRVALGCMWTDLLGFEISCRKDYGEDGMGRSCRTSQGRSREAAPAAFRRLLKRRGTS